MMHESELEVVCGLMSDGELLSMNDKLQMMVQEKAYQTPRFPLSLGGVKWVQAIVMFSYWMRRGKGIRLERGEVVLCELSESPFVQKYEGKVEGSEPTLVGVGKTSVIPPPTRPALHLTKEIEGEWV